MSLLALLCACALALAPIAQGYFPERPGPYYPATRGEVWPKPQRETKQTNYYVIQPHLFKFEVVGESCIILTRAIDRYKGLVEALSVERRGLRRRMRRLPRHLQPPPTPREAAFRGLQRTLYVNLTRPCEEYPYYKMDEAYRLTVDSTSSLIADSIWGVLRGLESFSHLLYVTEDFTEIRINGTSISDFPRYPHRGLLVDSGRHHLPLSLLRRAVDGLAANKMNVLHWHLVDDQSFPYVSQMYPELSLRGAYHPSLVYTPEDITELIEYARDRGVRIIPEVDVPGHTLSWGLAYPSLLTQCYDNAGKPTTLGPLNPINPDVYKVLRGMIQELQLLFPDNFYHIGGDEVDRTCWDSNPELVEYMQRHNMSSSQELHAYFMNQTVPLLAPGTTPLVWQEVFLENVPLNNNTLIQIWKGEDANNVMRQAIEAGHEVLYSSQWYLDHLQVGVKEMYSADPRELIGARHAESVAGGEACMWGEMVDETNFMTRVWPRSSAVAEVLWSARAPATASTWSRLEEHACRMTRRGLHAQPPAGPGYCLLAR